MTTNLILVPAQAQAAYIAGTALKSVDATIDIIFAINGKNQFFSLWETTAGHVKVATGAFKEQYDSWQAFGEAYSVPEVKPAFDLDKLVAEAQARVAAVIDVSVAQHKGILEFSFFQARVRMEYLFPQQTAYDRLLASRAWPVYRGALKALNPFTSGDQLIPADVYWDRLCEIGAVEAKITHQ